MIPGVQARPSTPDVAVSPDATPSMRDARAPPAQCRGSGPRGGEAAGPAGARTSPPSIRGCRRHRRHDPRRTEPPCCLRTQGHAPLGGPRPPGVSPARPGLTRRWLTCAGYTRPHGQVRNAPGGGSRERPRTRLTAMALTPQPLPPGRQSEAPTTRQAVCTGEPSSEVPSQPA